MANGAKNAAGAAPAGGGRIVLIRCERKVGLGDLLSDDHLVALPPNVSPLPVVRCDVASRAALTKALGGLQDSDILILNAHSNTKLFQYPDNGVIQDVNWDDIWTHVGRKKPPRLAAVLLAACMRSSEKDPPVRMDELAEIRRALHTTILAAPQRTYDVQMGAVAAGDGNRDDKTAKKIITNLVDCYKGKMDTGRFLEKFREKDGSGVSFQDRFGIAFGCNGYNHPLGCNCGFGMPRHLGPEVDRALYFMRWLLPRMW